MSYSLICSICNEPAEGAELPHSILTKKGSDTINQASKSRKDDIRVSSGEVVHQVCRRNYINPQQIAIVLKEKQEEVEQRHVLRSAEKDFRYDRDCLFCGRRVQIGTKRKSSKYIFFPDRTVEFKDALLKCCIERGDDWSATVQARVLNVHDLHAADAMYHQVCSVNFRTNKTMPADHQDPETDFKKSKIGRHKDEKKKSKPF